MKKGAPSAEVVVSAAEDVPAVPADMLAVVAVVSVVAEVDAVVVIELVMSVEVTEASSPLVHETNAERVQIKSLLRMAGAYQRLRTTQARTVGFFPPEEHHDYL